jgi:hypothetical protein
VASFVVGSSAKLTVQFKNDLGNEADPEVVALKVMNPSGQISTYTFANGEVTRDAVGKFDKSIDLPTAGTWKYRWEGSGTVTAATEAEIEVLRSVFV